MTARTVQDWFQFIQDGNDDGKLVRQVLAELSDEYQWDRPGRESNEKLQYLLNLITAVRLDQMVKEGSP